VSRMPPEPAGRGMFVVIEGLDGSGTTTQARHLVRWFAEQTLPVRHCNEPTAGPFGSALRMHLGRRLVASPVGGEAEVLSEYATALAFAADRMDHVHNEILPTLARGTHVVEDRYYLSSLAYQSQKVNYDWVWELNRFALRPDLTIFLRVNPAECSKRIRASRPGLEAYESEETLRAVAESYEYAIAREQGAGQVIYEVDGELPEEAVAKRVRGVVAGAIRRQS
jgi:dTMP kinase